MTREEFAQAMRCAVATVYRWEETEKDPQGLYGELLGYMAERLRGRPIAAERWGPMLQRAPSMGRWLIALLMAPPPLRSGRYKEYGDVLGWLQLERSKDVHLKFVAEHGPLDGGENASDDPGEEPERDP